MNRRSFLLGLLSTAAAPALAKAMPLHLNEIGFPKIHWRKIHEGVSWTGYDSIYNGVPIRQIDSIVEMMSQENVLLKGIVGDYPSFYDEASNMTPEMWEVEDE